MDGQGNIRCDVRTYLGREDGFRFGELHFQPGGSRHFLLDRLNHSIKMWQAIRSGGDKPDRDPAHIASAMDALAELEPMP